MKSIKLETNVVSVADFKAHASRWFDRIREDGEPVVITHNGKPAAVVLSPAEYDRLGAQQRLLESVAAGLADAEAGRTMSTAELKKRLRARRPAKS